MAEHCCFCANACQIQCDADLSSGCSWTYRSWCGCRLALAWWCWSVVCKIFCVWLIKARLCLFAQRWIEVRGARIQLGVLALLVRVGRNFWFSMHQESADAATHCYWILPEQESASVPAFAFCSLGGVVRTLACEEAFIKQQHFLMVEVPGHNCCSRSM